MPELARALGDRVRHQPVETDGRQQQREPGQACQATGPARAASQPLRLAHRRSCGTSRTAAEDRPRPSTASSAATTPCSGPAVAPPSSAQTRCAPSSPCCRSLARQECTRQASRSTGPKLPQPAFCWMSPTMPTIARGRARPDLPPDRIFDRGELRRTNAWLTTMTGSVHGAIGLVQVPPAHERNAQRFEVAGRDVRLVEDRDDFGTRPSHAPTCRRYSARARTAASDTRPRSATPGISREPCERLLEQPIHAFGCRVSRVLQREARRHHVRAVESGAQIHQMIERPDHEPRADQQHDAERDLARRPSAVAASGSRGRRHCRRTRTSASRRLTRVA